MDLSGRLVYVLDVDGVINATLVNLKEGKTSGNPEIDNLIYESQLNTKYYHRNLEWNLMIDLKILIFSATSVGGKPDYIHYIDFGKYSILFPLHVIYFINSYLFHC